MNLSVSYQLHQFLLSVNLGVALAFLWTFFRALRMARPRLTHLCDLLFGLILLPTLLLFALYVGNGQFRIFFFPGIFLGAALCFFFPCPYVLRILLAAFRLFAAGIRLFCLPFRIFLKFFHKIGKNIFSFAKKWVMMNHTNVNTSSDNTEPPGGKQDEIQKVVAADKAHCRRDRHRRHHHAGLSAVTAGGNSGIRRRTGNRGLRNRA